MRVLAALTAGAVALASQSSVQATVSSRPTYLLSMQLHDGTRLVGAPSLRVSSGEMATVSISEAEGDHYRVCVTALPGPTGKVSIHSTVDVVSLGRHAGGSPRVVVGYGERRSLAIAADDGAGTPFRVDLTVKKAA